MQLAWKVNEGSKVRLKDYDPDIVDKYTDRALAAAETEKLSENWGRCSSWWRRRSITACSSSSRGWIRAAKMARFARSWHKSIRWDARCVRLRDLRPGNRRMISSGGSIGSFQAEA